MRVAGNLVVHFTELLFLCSLFFILLATLPTATRGTKSRKWRIGSNTLRVDQESGKRSRFVNNHARANAVANAIMLSQNELEQGKQAPLRSI
jgi:hypothetical protein